MLLPGGGGGEVTKPPVYRLHEIFKRISSNRAVVYRCFENTSTAEYSVQSADYFQVPVSLEQIAHNRLQMLELFIECDPGERSGRFPTAEAAIEDFDRSFEQTE